MITLLILTTILLALSGLAIMHLAARLKEAQTTQANDLHMIKTMKLHISDMLEVTAVNEQLTAHNRELNAKFAELKSIYWNRCIQLAAENDENKARTESLEQELIHNKARAYNREQELLSALEDATKAADDNEWLFNDARQCELDAVKELEELQEVHKSYVEGASEFTANQAREITDLQDTIFAYQTEIHHKAIRIAELKRNLKSLKEELAETKTLADNLMSDRIEAIAHMKEQNEQIAQLELDAFYAAEADLTEAIEAAEEAPIHIDEKKAWICIGEWSRLIVYKHNPYQPYVQHGLGGKIERTKRKDLTTKAQEKYNALKAALKSL